MPIQAWNIYLNGKKIDTVFYPPHHGSEYVRLGLINHDGFDPGITVRRSNRV